jgi:plasmid stabilization system protein ParE
MKKKRLEWSLTAKVEFAEVLKFYAERNLTAAKRIRNTINEAALSLIAQPLAHPGRIGFIKNTRELVVGHRVPFTLIYRSNDEVVEILHVWHQARNL